MRTTHSKVRHRFAACAVVALIIASCGSDDDTNSSDSAADGTAPAAATDPASTESSASTATNPGSSPPSDSPPPGTDAGDAGDPIVIGHTAGETGFLSFYDMPIRAGMELAIADVNAEGGVLGRQLAMVTSDNQSDIAQLESSALDVVEQGADFVVTTCDYDFGGPAARVATDDGMIAMSCSGGPLYGVEGIGPLAFNIYHGSPTEGAIMAEFARDQGWTTPFVLTDDSIEYTRVISEYFVTRWQEINGEGSASNAATFGNADDSIAAQIGDIRDSGADFIVLPSYAPGGPAALRQIRAAGIDLPILGANAMDGVYWLDAVPDLSNFYLLSTGSIHGDDPSADRTAFFDRYTTETGAAPLSANYALTGYSIIEALVKGIEEADSIEAEAVAAVLNTFDAEPLLIGETTWTPECHISYDRPMLVLEYEQGTVSYLETRQVESLPEAIC
jgi:branched-chain amino acid transport system substrate-binding protein